MSATSTKIFVGSLAEGTTVDDIRALFEAHGPVEECDVIKDYGFVHMTNYDDAQSAINALNGHEFRGTAINVEESRSKVRQKPGMGGKMTCFRCGREGHWSKECRWSGGSGGRGGFRPRPGPYDRRPPHPPPFERRPPPSSSYDYDGYDRRRSYNDGGYYDRYDHGGYDEYDRGYDRPNYENNRGVPYDSRHQGPQYDDRRMDYYARRSPPRDYYRDAEYANGGGAYRANERRPPPYGGPERFAGGRYGRGNY